MFFVVVVFVCLFFLFVLFVLFVVLFIIFNIPTETGVEGCVALNLAETETFKPYSDQKHNY